MKRTGSKGGRQKVYRHPAAAAELWRGPIERIAWGGRGLARAEDGRLLLLAAPLALFPGEEVEAQVRWKARHGEGEVLRWIRRAPQRTEPDCPVANACGGCDLQGAGSATATLKRAMVEDLLHRQLPEAPDLEWRPAPEAARRHRIQLHWDGAALGFHARGSHRLVPVAGCPAAAEALSAAIPRLQEALAAQVLPHRPQRWELLTGTPPGEVWGVDERGRAWRLEPDGWKRGAGGVFHAFAGRRIGHAPGGFFQACPAWAAEAFGGLLAEWEVGGATLYDLYGGVGLFSVLLRDRFHRFVLVESAEDALPWARHNLEGLDAEVHGADVQAWLQPGLGVADDLLLLDPPRTGLGPELCARLQAADAGRLVLVGCDGAAFCRDVKDLGPGWRLRRLAALDLFPLTVHAEFVGLFARA